MKISTAVQTELNNIEHFIKVYNSLRSKNTKELKEMGFNSIIIDGEAYDLNREDEIKEKASEAFHNLIFMYGHKELNKTEIEALDKLYRYWYGVPVDENEE